MPVRSGGASNTTASPQPDEANNPSNPTTPNDGWLIAPVTVALSTQDITRKGNYLIEYSTNGEDWTGNGGGSEFVFEYAEEGTTTMQYRATDLLGNVEDEKQHPFKIDTRAPEVAITVNQPVLTRVEQFAVNFTINDPQPGSGIDSVVGFLDGDEVADNQSIDLLWFALGEHTLEVTATGGRLVRH